uniref:Uncharacterized protein n=1 Tax=Romanomermis culicivorax TaxID=13658 RepID=A0A915I0W7_ROMCU
MNTVSSKEQSVERARWITEHSETVRVRRVFNGLEVEQLSMPWTVILYNGGYPICGAFLISRPPNMHID